MKKLFAFALILSFVFAGCTPAKESSGEGAASYTPGTYTAVSKGYGGDVSVTLTVDENKITDVQITGDAETKGIGSNAVDKLPAAIFEAQSTEVDGVSGATMTSSAIKEAAAAAILQAKGGSASKVSMTPGTYEAAAYGFQQISPVNISVTVDETAILSIKITDTKDSVGMVRSVETNLIPRIIENQSVAVDAITGATNTSNAVLTATKTALSKALEAGGSDASAISNFMAPEKKEGIGKEQTIDTDVLVVGLGGSGTAAAMSTLEQQLAAGQDASVLAIDRAGRLGGTTVFTGDIMGVNAPGFVEEYNEGKDYVDIEDFFAEWMSYTDGDAKSEIVRKFLENSGDTIDWLRNDHDFILLPPRGGFGTPWVCVYNYASRATYKPELEYPDTYNGAEEFEGQGTMLDKYFGRLYETYESMGGKYMLETEAYELIYDEASNTVTGVLARGHDGTEYVIHAKAVILATGGFAGSEKLEKEYLGKNPYFEHLGDSQWQLIGMYQNTGLMFEAAVNIGAGTYNADMPPMVHFAGTNIIMHDYEVHTDEGINLWYGWDKTWSLNDVPNNLALSSNVPWVDADGDRFIPEGGMFQWWRAGPYYWAVYSQDILDSVAANGFTGSTSTLANATQGGVKAGIPIPEMQTIVDKLTASDQIAKADNFEDLAKQMGVDAATFAAEMEKYDTYCKTGVDEDFGKEQAKLVPFGEGPYYAIKCYSHAFSTVGGLDINEDMQVLKADGKTPILGLYAVGTESGGVLYSNKQPYVNYGGAAMGWAYTSGRLAGYEVVDYIAGMN